jgi:16S rRNA (guanine527-N7)-methyltransferase
MDQAQIAELLHPFLEPDGNPGSFALTGAQLNNISMYLDILLRWNARINLTALRDPEEIVTRHFGESLFAARHLFPLRADEAPTQGDLMDLIDVGSGAGFPGLAVKIWDLHLRVTLIESSQKKATFLREAVRRLTLADINVFSARAQAFSGCALVVTLRAVERFSDALPAAAALLAPAGRLALLISQSQVATAHKLTPSFSWSAPIPIPLSAHRILLIGASQAATNA